MVFGICERVEGRAYVIVVCVCAIEGGGGGGGGLGVGGLYALLEIWEIYLP